MPLCLFQTGHTQFSSVPESCVVAGSSPRQEPRGFFLLQSQLFCADSYLVIISTPVLPQRHVTDPGHSAKNAGGRLQLSTTQGR